MWFISGTSASRRRGGKLGLWAARVVLAMVSLMAPATGQYQAYERAVAGMPAGNGVSPVFEVGYVQPQMHKWYGARHLVDGYTRPWYLSDTRYASQAYSRYINRLLEGEDFYDGLGNPLGRGWMVYSWSQQQPQPRGSSITKQPTLAVRNTRDAGFGFDAYRSYFEQLVIASDGDGDGAYRLMVGDEIYTAFTPLTFYKPRFDGVRFDYERDRLAMTVLSSRLSDPDGARQPGPGEDPLDLRPQAGGGSRSHSTHLLAGHAEAKLGAAGRLGLSYINTRNSSTQLKLNNGNLLRGALTAQQNQSLRTLWVRLRDDSPLDRVGGATLLAHDIVLTDTSGNRFRGSEIGLRPVVSGGVEEAGVLVADGGAAIVLQYDLEGLDAEELDSGAIRRAQIELSLADDYRVEMASDLQTDGERRSAVVFLPVQRASGNVQDKSNTRVVAIDYALPVSSEIIGVDWDMPSWHGLSVQGELALNRRFSRYPNPNVERHYQKEERAAAFYLNAAYRRRPWQLFFEGFSIAHDYSTNYWLTTESGTIKYSDPVPQLYELVDDDDDRDGLPEWERPYQPWREIAWPGFDENRDFHNDYNQNDNLIPDYDEPFLRYRSERPEFLVGLDMNHNGIVDRLENDELPDYPYKRDHRGFNAYVQANAGPDLRLTAGWQRLRLVAGDGRTRSVYGMAAYKRDTAAGHLRLFAHGARVRDDIPDDTVQWFQPVDALGFMRQVDDGLPGRDADNAVLYGDWLQRWGTGPRLLHRFKWSTWRQRQGAEDLAGRGVRRLSGFTGVVNKGEWSLPVGLGVLQPRFKSEWRRDRPLDRRTPQVSSLEETLFLIWTQPLLAERVGVAYYPRYGRQSFNTELQAGLESSWFWLLQGERDGVTEDFFRWTAIVQLSNRVAYEGYSLVTRAGLRLSAWDFDHSRGQSTSLFFLTINAGLR
jgi:hypothetical protein